MLSRITQCYLPGAVLKKYLGSSPQTEVPKAPNGERRAGWGLGSVVIPGRKRILAYF